MRLADLHRNAVRLAVMACATTTLGCYGTAHGQRADAEAAWRRGDHVVAIAKARAMYARYAKANPDAAMKVTEALPLVRERMSDELVIPKDLRPGPPPDVAKHDDNPKGRAGSPQHELTAAVLTLDAGVALPAIASIQNLHMTRLAPPLLAVLDRPEPFTDSSRLTRGLDTATRSLVVKRAALDALETLAPPRPSEPAPRP